MDLLQDQNGKNSTARFLSIGAFITACLLVIYACIIKIIVKDSMIFNEINPVIMTFLGFAAGIKVGSKFGEKSNEKNIWQN